MNYQNFNSLFAMTEKKVSQVEKTGKARKKKTR